MTQNWTVSSLQQFIENSVEESLTLEYKSADSLGRQDKKKNEITKDISSMANSAGGIVIYGITEYDQNDKRHLPEKLDPIRRTDFTKEWLENIIDNIKPKIDGLIIYPIQMEDNSNKVIYIVEIPQSTTAHQASDYRYYKRYNFKSVPMDDYEVKDVINRLKVAEADIIFKYKLVENTQNYHDYELIITLKNTGVKLIHNYKIEFTLPLFLQIFPSEGVCYKKSTRYQSYIITYKSKELVYPKEEIEISDSYSLRYRINDESYNKLEDAAIYRNPYCLTWTLYADEMTPKNGKVEMSKLNEY